jgi:serine/threonine protein kinase
MIAPQTLLQNRYLVISQIGQGGMGAVYVATDQRFGSTVALKETFFTDPALRRAFEREARLLNRLRHHALPRVSDHFLEEEGQFLVMEYIAGDDLWEMLKAQGGAFPLKEVLDWADQLLDALDYLHTQEPSVIHRDIKPQNLKLTPRGQIVLLDFGLAKGNPLQASQATATGSIFGYSRNYAPIEQIQGTGTDTRSDLYSLAATLYHLLTGATPPDALTRAAAVLNGQPDPLRPANEMHGQVTPAVAQVLMRAMSQNAGHRPQTAAAMREELREAGRQTLLTGQTTNAQNLATAPLLEQDTQLMGAQDNAAAPTVADAAHTEKMGSVMAFADIGDAAGLATSGGTPPATSRGEAESVVTQISPAPAATRKRAFSGRTLGIAASFVMLLLVAAVVYALTRRAAAPATNTGTPAQTTNPPANTGTAEQSTANQNVEKDAVQPSDVQPTAQRKPDKSTKRNEEPAKPKETSGIPNNLPPPPSQTRPVAPPAPPGRNDPAYWTPERIAEEQRKAQEARDRAIEEKMRAQEEARRLRQLRRRERMRRP